MTEAEARERAARNGPFVEFMVRAASDCWQAKDGSLEGFEAHLGKLIDWSRSQMPKLLIDVWLRLALSEGKELVARRRRSVASGKKAVRVRP
jgi:hypothetical protein